jgi:hypothetical protein
VWDPQFIREQGAYEAPPAQTPRIFLIGEPNISFQKNALIPIMAMEAYYRKFPALVDSVIVINGHKLKESAYFTNSVLPNLTIFAQGKLQLMPRAHMTNIVKAFPHATVLQHQVNNAYNYSFLEWITLGFPVIHNVKAFQEYGYYYDENDFMAAAKQIEAIDGHIPDVYAAQASQLAWRFSIHNPENMAGWNIALS